MATTMKITVPPVAERLKWKELGDLPWDGATIMEIVQRYCDAQDHARNYRQRAALKNKLLKSRLEELAKASGMSVEAYLELEESNAAGTGADGEQL